RLYRIPAHGHCPSIGFNVNGRQVIKILGRGSQSVMPPSRHASGGTYEWWTDRRPGEIEIAPCPQWLDRMLEQRAQGQQTGGTSQIGLGADNIDGEIPQGARDNTLYAIGCHWRNYSLTEDEIYYGLAAINQARCVPPLPESVVRAKARQAARWLPRYAR